MKRDKQMYLFLVNVSRLFEYVVGSESELQLAVLEKSNKRLLTLLKELDKLRETYELLPDKVKAEEELKTVSWKKNDDGSLWVNAETIPYTRKLLEENNGKIILENMKLYLTRNGYVKAYPIKHSEKKRKNKFRESHGSN